MKADGNVTSVTLATKSKEMRCKKYLEEKKAAWNASPRAMQHGLRIVDAGCSGLFYCIHGRDREQHIKWLRE